MEAKNLAELYDLPLVDWKRVEARLDGPGAAGRRPAAPTPTRSWLATTKTGRQART